MQQLLICSLYMMCTRLMPAKLANATDALDIRVRYARGPDVGSDNALSSSCVTDFHPNRPLAFLGDGCQNWLDIEYLTCVVFIPCGKTAPISRQVCRSKVPRNSQAFDKKAFEMPFAMPLAIISRWATLLEGGAVTSPLSFSGVMCKFSIVLPTCL